MPILFVANIDLTVSVKQLEKLFRKYGLVNCKLMVDKKSGDSRGFAFIELETEESAGRARNDLDGFDFHGRKLTILEARAGEKQT